MSALALKDVVEALDAHHLHDADVELAALWKSLQKADKELFAPLKPLMTSKYIMPTSTAVLQLAVETGGALTAVVDELIAVTRREVWRADGEPVALKNGPALAVFRAGEVVRAGFGNGKGKFDVYDVRTRELMWSFSEPRVAHSYFFVDPDTVRAVLPAGTVVEHKQGVKKPRVIASYEDVCSGCVVADHVAVAKKIVDPDGNDSFVIVVDGAEVALDGVTDVGRVDIIGDRVYVGVCNAAGDGGFIVVDANGRDARVAGTTWLPRLASGDAERAHRFVAIGGVPWLVTQWSRWLRLPDLVEDTRFGTDFDNVDICGDTVWSGRGHRVTLSAAPSARSTPISFRGNSFSVIAIDDDNVVASFIDPKDKVWLQRFRRHLGV